MLLSSASSPPFVLCATTVEIGVISSTTDGLENYATIIDLANKDITDYMAQKGLDYSFTYWIEDAQGSAAVHLEHVQKFKSIGIDLLIGGGWSSQASASLSYINENDMLLISASSTSPLLAIPGDNLFRVCPDDRSQAPAIAEMLNSWGIKAIIVIQRADIWADGIYNALANDYPALGGVIAERIRYVNDATEFSSYLARAEEIAKELVGQYGAENVGIEIISMTESVAIVAQARDYPTIYNLKWFGTDGTSLNQQLIDNAPEESDHLKIFSTLAAPLDSEKFWNVYERYYLFSNQPLTYYTAALYDACWVYALSIIEANSADAMKIKTVLPSVASNYVGITGQCMLNEAGDRFKTNYDIWGYGIEDSSGKNVKYGYYDSGSQRVIWDTTLITPPSMQNIHPVAVINGPYSGVAGQSMSFSSSGSHDPDGNIVEYNWNFGDGYTATSANPSHAYRNAGTYTVTLTVRDNQGATNTATTSCTIEALPPDDGNGGFPWLPVLAVFIVAAAVAVYFYMQKMKQGVPVPKAVEFNIGFEPEEIPADGKSTSIITIGLLDSEGKPYEATEDTTVTISSSGGLLVSSSEVKKDEVTGTMTITDSVRKAVESLLTQTPEGGMRISIKQGETSVEAAIVSSLKVGDVTLSVSAPGVRRRTVRMRFTEKRRYCMHCGSQMSIEDRACPKCGLMPPSGVDVKSCLNCGEVIPSMAKFCSECGAGQPPPQ